MLLLLRFLGTFLIINTKSEMHTASTDSYLFTSSNMIQVSYKTVL